jgi:hypothetical protein
VNQAAEATLLETVRHMHRIRPMILPPEMPDDPERDADHRMDR